MTEQFAWKHFYWYLTNDGKELMHFITMSIHWIYEVEEFFLKVPHMTYESGFQKCLQLAK